MFYLLSRVLHFTLKKQYLFNIKPNRKKHKYIDYIIFSSNRYKSKWSLSGALMYNFKIT